MIATGGLGPTADDLTRPSIAAAADCELELNETALAHIEGLFAKRKREMPERNRSQAMFPIGSRMIHNPHGSAPGIDMVVKHGEHSSRIFAFPGVPAELKEMWAESISPILCELTGNTRRVIQHRRIKCFGVGESDLEQMLPDLIRRGREPTVGITVHKATITLRITAHGESPEACDALIAPTEATIRECLGDLVFGEEDDELHHAVDRLLRAENKTLAAAEWSTEGMIARWMRELPDDGSCFNGGVVLGSESVLPSSLNVPAQVAQQHGRVSREVVGAMATAVRDRFSADFGVAVSAFPREDEHDRIYLGLATDDGITVKHRIHGGHPDIWVERTAKLALDMVRKELM